MLYSIVTQIQVMKYYQIKNKEMPWGDYGNSLLTGTLEGDDEKLKLSRTGPYIPPIVQMSINDLVVTDELRTKIEASELTGFNFEEIKPVKIVRIDWRNWDFDSEEPEFYPESGEPEDYIEEGTNDPELLANSGDFWKLTFPNSVELELRQGGEWWQKIPVINSDSWPNSNFAISDQILHNFIDQTAKDWLEQNCDGNLEFEEVESK